eukprot:CAMPEP_0185262624 /NCGR_PEP_ID=MMETSP1359-20130426/10725_1 /TAXON_ID=552665 /ORGANISM="Bigelowiella longifila, Strain CCMP242" /LENGTH=158 /DNA_ID=CAMNT_0027849621 /DNA_START=348 /DNA_END=824 /DNA_ORIENTATION=+
MKRNHMSFANCCEYTQDREISRARQLFFQGDVQYLLMTERFYFFKRYRIRGAHHCIFYAPPEHCDFYYEVLNLLQPTGGGLLDSSFSALSAAWSDNMCAILYTKYDVLSLARIVGEQRAQRMVAGINVSEEIADARGDDAEMCDRGTYVFVSNSSTTA